MLFLGKCSVISMRYDQDGNITESFNDDLHVLVKKEASFHSFHE